MMNYTANYLFLHSALHSPLISPSRSSISYSFKNCKFTRFFNNFYRSSSSLVKERVQIKKTKFSSFVTTPLSIAPDYQSQIIKTRIEVAATDQTTSLTIIDCQFKDITSDDRGAAIRIAKHVPLVLSNSQFYNVVSRYEAAILFVLIGLKTWSLEPININDCFFDSCYSTGENFRILDNYSDKYPSVLIHEFLGFRSTSIESNTNSISAVNCQENKVSRKRFGAYIHHHANTFQLNYFNCTNSNKIDSSQIFFTQSHKQASNVNYIYAVGQAGYSLIEIKDIQSTDQLTFQYLDIYNSTLFTEEVVTSGNNTSTVKASYGIIDFGGSYDGSLVFINCHIYFITTDNENYAPTLSFTSNGRLPIFANCYSNVQSIAYNQGFLFGTPFQPTSIASTSIPSPTTVKIPAETPSQSPTEIMQNNLNMAKNKSKNIIAVSVPILTAIVVTVIALVTARRYLFRKITFIDETDDSTLENKDLIETLNNNDAPHNAEDINVQ